MSISDETFDKIKATILRLFDAPTRQIEVWINENEKSFGSNDIEDIDIFDALALYFCKEFWPRDNTKTAEKKIFFEKLSHNSYLHDWELKHIEGVS